MYQGYHQQDIEGQAPPHQVMKEPLLNRKYNCVKCRETKILRAFTVVDGVPLNICKKCEGSECRFCLCWIAGLIPCVGCAPRNMLVNIGVLDIFLRGLCCPYDHERAINEIYFFPPIFLLCSCERCCPV